jgi:GAF domain-containing protein
MSARPSPYAHVAPIGKRLTHSLDFDDTLDQVARLPVPSMADWSLAYTPGDGDARMPRVALAHASPAREELLRGIWQRHPVMLPHQHPIMVSLRSRKPVLQPVCSPADLDALCLSNGDGEVLRSVGVRSLLVVPMVAHGLVVGALMLVGATRQRGKFDQAALEAANAVASCCAQAIYNAQLFWEARLAARMRQEVLAAGSQDLMWLAGRIQRRVSQLRGELLNAEVTSADDVQGGLTEIEDLSGAIRQRIDDLRLMARGRLR